MKMLIDSQWVDASDGKWREVRNPGTGEVIDKVPQATLDDAKGALEAAQHAKEAMRRMPCVPAAPNCSFGSPKRWRTTRSR